MGTDRLEEVRTHLDFTLQKAMAEDPIKRQGCWTESLAVGGLCFLQRVKLLILSRRETEIVEAGAELWVLKENEIPYGQKRPRKTSAKA